MNEIWVVSVRTSLEEVCENYGDVYAFDSFDKACEKVHSVIKEFAFSENSMFDGEGHISYLKRYIDDLEKFDDAADDFLTKSKLTEFQELLKNIFEGKSTSLDNIDRTFTVMNDGFICANVSADSLSIYGDCDGPINGYDPDIRTNMFDMNEEKDYYLYINDLLGQDYSSELYIDLKKTTIE